MARLEFYLKVQDFWAFDAGELCEVAFERDGTYCVGMTEDTKLLEVRHVYVTRKMVLRKVSVEELVLA